jgi:AcrR family transcriptional regulator
VPTPRSATLRRQAGRSGEKGRLVTTAGRQRVLDAALTRFSEHGFAATSMRDLADDLNLRAASLYSHYPGGKDELLATVLTPFLDGVDVLLQLDNDELDASAWLRAYASHLAAHAPAVRLAGADLAVARHDRIGHRLTDSNARTRALLRRHHTLTEPQAAAVLGHLWWPIICLPHAPSHDELLQLASTALRAASPPPTTQAKP